MKNVRDKGQLFSEMHKAAIERLRLQNAEQISRLGDIPFDGSSFRFGCLGQRITVSYPEYDVSPELDMWQILVILHYLADADGTPLSGKQITFSEYRDGMVRGGGFDRDVEDIIRKELGILSAAELEKRCLEAGAERAPSNADFCVKFEMMPRYPVWLKIWFADEDFPASGRMLLDSSAEHYLSIEDAVTVGTLILDRLKQR